MVGDAPQQNLIPQQLPPQQQDVNGIRERPDFLAFIYKSIRFVFLMIVVYLYSSFERFIGAALIITFVYFVQQRRQNRVEQQQAPQPVAPNQLNDNNTNQEEEGEAPIAAVPSNRTQSFNAWNVFCSTVTSFFESMIPENPQVPVNIN